MKWLNVLLLFVIACVASPLRADIVSFNASAEFDLVANPSGVWSYGYRSAAAAGDLQPFSQRGDYPYVTGVGTWFKGWYQSTTTPPHIFQNVSGSVQSFSTIPAVQPGQLVMHPGADPIGFAVIRWTAPDAGHIDVIANFSRIDSGSEASDAFVVYNGSILQQDSLTGSGDAAYLPVKSLSVAANDVLDFVVGAGSDGYFGDSTALDATIHFTAVPEPSTLGLMCVGCMALALTVRLRRRKHVN